MEVVFSASGYRRYVTLRQAGPATKRLKGRKNRPELIALPIICGVHSTQMMGDQEPGETLTKPMITMWSNLIFPCPRRHCSSTRISNGNSYRKQSINPYERRRYELTSLLASRSSICHLTHLATSWTSLLLVIELAASPRFLVESYPTFLVRRDPLHFQPTRTCMDLALVLPSFSAFCSSTFSSLVLETYPEN